VFWLFWVLLVFEFTVTSFLIGLWVVVRGSLCCMWFCGLMGFLGFCSGFVVAMFGLFGNIWCFSDFRCFAVFLLFWVVCVYFGAFSGILRCLGLV